MNIFLLKTNTNQISIEVASWRYSITVSCIQAVSGRGAVLDAPVWGGGENAVKPSTSVLSQGEVK